MAEQKQPKEWELRQAKTFCKWTNIYLRRKGYPMIEEGHLHEAFHDGIRLMQLINALYDIKIPKHNRKPKMRPQYIDNINQALKMIEQAQIKTNFLKNVNLADKDFKMVIGMVWAIILDYNIKGISVGDATAKDGLLIWCRKKTKGYKHVNGKINNFHKNWKNGMAFNALIHRHYPKLIDYASLDPANAAENLENAFKVCEDCFDIPRLIDVDDMLVPMPDERSVMTYVSELFKLFSQQDAKEKGARHLHNFVEFQRRLEVLCTDYDTRVRTFQTWVDDAITKFENPDFGKNQTEATERMELYKRWILEEKPRQLADKIELEELYANIQTELAVNGRRPWAPPDEIAPGSLVQSLVRLQEAEAKYSAALTENRFQYIQKLESGQVSPEKIQEFEDAFDYFDADKSGLLEFNEFKAALSAVGVALPDDDQKRTFESLSEDGSAVTRDSFVRFLTAMHEESDTPEAIVGSSELLGNPQNLKPEDLMTPPLTDEDRAWLMEKLENGNLDLFVRNLFDEAEE